MDRRTSLEAAGAPTSSALGNAMAAWAGTRGGSVAVGMREAVHVLCEEATNLVSPPFPYGDEMRDWRELVVAGERWGEGKGRNRWGRCAVVLVATMDFKGGEM
ncbi:Os05g0527600 [Oryza sativa Japonica Group]|uniref:Os05g0527600 protein n=1 Tax=Oryza sativa subsp. japonica TaxID=39947 RepID=C7J228_ORYSJ|nr:Os05g0527600 [Oryza sativa Japonica Group]|eukprot:NP_001174498.1 Os05g0527600 [Oryza sativa Japonica Group]